jgi:hypothetical protein
MVRIGALPRGKAVSQPDHRVAACPDSGVLAGLTRAEGPARALAQAQAPLVGPCAEQSAAGHQGYHEPAGSFSHTEMCAVLAS